MKRICHKKIRHWTVMLVLASGLAACEAGEEGDHPARIAAMEALSGPAIHGHMEALAADGMAGREAGTGAYQRAADYVASLCPESLDESSDPTIDGAAMLTDFLDRHYHQPSDEPSLPFSDEGAQRFARAAMLLGLIVADQEERPQWNESDFFGERFGRGVAAQNRTSSP